MQPSARIIDKIKFFEGLRLHKYKDIGGIDTIGYGHCGNNLPEEITLSQAEDYFERDVYLTSNGVNQLIKVPLTQPQFDALVDFSFNLGLGVLKASTLRSKLNRREYSAVPKQINRWVHDKGIVVPALVERRDYEARLFTS